MLTHTHTHTNPPGQSIEAISRTSRVHKYEHAVCTHCDNLFMSISPFGSDVGVGRFTNAYNIQTVCAAAKDLHIGHINE